jgi:hypothetical protein
MNHNRGIMQDVENMVMGLLVPEKALNLFTNCAKISFFSRNIPYAGR